MNVEKVRYFFCKNNMCRDFVKQILTLTRVPAKKKGSFFRLNVEDEQNKVTVTQPPRHVDFFRHVAGAFTVQPGSWLGLLDRSPALRSRPTQEEGEFDLCQACHGGGGFGVSSDAGLFSDQVAQKKNDNEKE